MNCPNCGQANPPGQPICSRCGAALTPAQGRGVTASLNRLGIPITTGQWVGAVAAVLAGGIAARIMPYLYPILFSIPLDFVFGPGPSTLRDGFNSLLMTACTFGTSFVVAFFAIFLFHPKRKVRR